MKKYVWELGPPDQWDAARERFFDSRGEGEGDRAELAFLKPDGHQALLNCRSVVIELEGKSLRQLIVCEEK
jgi:hypothetical protein